MCQHDHSTPTEPVAPDLARRAVFTGAAAVAALTASGVAATSAEAAVGAAVGAAPTTGRAGGWPGPAPEWPDPVVIRGGNLVDPLTGDVVEDSVVVLARGRVAASGPAGRVRVPAGAVEVAAEGRWVVPGLVDAHVHANSFADAAAVLAAGATSVRSGSSTFFQDVALRELPRWRPGIAPRMVPAGIFVTPQLGDGVLADPDLAPLASLPDGVRTPAELRYLTRVVVGRGADVVKTRANPRAGLPEQDPTELVYDREQVAAVVSAAGRRGVLCHAYSAEGIDGAVRAGVRSIEHGVFVSEETLHRMARRGTFFTPTMGAIVGLLRSSNPVLAARGREYVPVLRAAVRAAHELGVPVVAGTDSFGTAVDPVGGEVELLVDAGLSALDGLRAATTLPARLVGQERWLGRLAPGFAADALVLTANPLEDPSALTAIETIVAQGVVRPASAA